MNAAKLFKRVILASCLSLLANSLPLQAADNPTPTIGPLNPDFIKWQQSGKVKMAAQAFTGNGGATGYIPSPFDWSHLRNEPIVNKFPRLGASSSDPRYDLRTDNAITSVKNQGTCGSCWNFATYGSLESWLLKNNGETWDFSEQNMKNTHRFDWPPCYGGNFDMATAYLARWSGAVDESDDPYSATDNTPHYGLPTLRHVKTVRIFADSASIKSALITYGAVASDMYWDTAYFTASNKSYYYSGANGSNHAVTIAGWDDTVTTGAGASKKGAWLIKNSWGTAWGNNGYFWISYFDAKACKTAYAFTDAVPVSSAETNYYYDSLGLIGSMGYGNHLYPNWDSAWGANIFTPSKEDSLAAVGFYAVANNTQYTITVYDSFKVSTGRFYTQLGSVTGTLTNAGYYTIPLSSKIHLASGTNFGVVVRFHTPGDTYPVPIEFPVFGYSDTARASSGQSYISPDGVTFQISISPRTPIPAFVYGRLDPHPRFRFLRRPRHPSSPPLRTVRQIKRHR